MEASAGRFWRMRVAVAGLIAAMVAPCALADQISAETGGRGAQYADAVMTPATDQPCAVAISFVRAGALAPVKDGFQLAVDLAIDLDHRADYKIGLANEGRATFAGGALHEVTREFKDGVFVIPNAPKYFDVEAVFGLGSSASAVIQRHCYGPRTRLIYVMDNPDTGASGGDWLWFKGGR